MKDKKDLPIIISAEVDFSVLGGSEGKFHKDNYNVGRSDLLKELRNVSGLPEMVKSLQGDKLYKLVVPEGKVLQLGKDGLWRGEFRGKDGTIKNIARFKKAGPDLMRAATAIGSQSLLIYMSIQLSEIKSQLEAISHGMTRDRIAKVLAGRSLYVTGLKFKDPVEQSLAFHSSIQTLCEGVRLVTGELADRIENAKDPDDQPSDHLYIGRKSSKPVKAQAEMNVAVQLFGAALLGIQTLAECYAALGEHEAADSALLESFELLEGCNIQSAARKARLLPVQGGQLPQAPWKTYLEEVPKLQTLMEYHQHLSHSENAKMEIEFRPEEIIRRR